MNEASLMPRIGPFRLSLIVPMLNEEASITALLERIVAIAEKTTPDYEIIAVNDGSTDHTLSMLVSAHVDNPRIKVVNLSRNFGKETALTAGINHATGDAVVLLDADLQHPPELVAEMVEKWREGYEVAIAIRADREDETVLRRTFARIFYWVMQRLSDVPFQADAGDFRLIDRKVADALKLLPENNRFMKGLYAWVGFRQAHIPFSPPPRREGTSTWNILKLWNFALDGIFSATTLPLRIWTYLGGGLALTALAYMLFIVSRTMIHGSDVPGYPSIAAMVLFFSGMNLIGLGVLGEYIGRVFIEVKRRPQYLVQDLIGFDREQEDDGVRTDPPKGKTIEREAPMALSRRAGGS